MAGTSHRPSKTCLSFFRMSQILKKIINLRIHPFLLLRSQQIRSIIRQPKTLFKPKWMTTSQKNTPTTHQSLLCPWDTPELAAKSTDRPGLLMQLTTAKPWPNLASSPSSASTCLPAFEHLHTALHSPMGILMQCHLTWQYNNKTGINVLMQWHGSSANILS